MDTESVARTLFDNVLHNRIREVEKCFQVGDSAQWRHVIRYEFGLHELTTCQQKELELIPKLMAYEITSVSSFHLAAMLGHSDLLVNLMDKDVPVDLPLKSGSTAFHIAAFAGQLNVVKLLKDVFRADIHLKDRYGWTTLHYASTEGHLNIVELLIEAGLDVNIRDQDGTTAAFRAQLNGHNDVVALLCQYGAEDELLNVDEGSDEEDGTKKSLDEQDGTKKSLDELYAKPNKSLKPSNRSMSIPDENRNEVPVAVQVREKASTAVDKHEALSRRQSAPGNLDAYVPSPKEKFLPPTHSHTLPTKTKRRSHGTIRRLLRRELRAVFGEDGYEFPIGDTIIPEESTEDGDVKLGKTHGLGVNTLKGIMREELERYRDEMAVKGLLDLPSPGASQRASSDYENIYQTLGLPDDRPPSPPAPGAPPLPPRNTDMLLTAWPNDPDELASTMASLSLGKQPSSAALNASVYKLAPLLGSNWKVLAHSLPLEATPAKVNARIKAIEAEHAGSVEKQAAMALVEWRINKGFKAEVDDLIIAMRKAGLHKIIPEVEKVTQEFTA